MNENLINTDLVSDSSEIELSDSDRESIIDNPGLTLMRFTFNIDKPLNEKKDIGIFKPDGINISYIKTHYEKLCHPDWKEIISPVKVRKSNQGRKPIKKESKRNKKSEGPNISFDSSFAFGVIYKNKSYSIRVFREKSGTFPGNGYKIKMIRDILKILFKFINESRPGTNIQLIDIKSDLKNMNYTYNMDRYNYMKNPTINLTKFVKHIVGNDGFIRFGNIEIFIIFGNIFQYVKGFHIMRDEFGVPIKNEKGNKYKICQFKLFPNGKLKILGCPDDGYIASKLATIIFQLITFISNQSNPEISNIIQNGITC